MGSFKSAVITAKGQALMAKVVAGTTKLAFTKVATSATDYSKQADLSTLTGIGTIKQSTAVASVEKVNNANVKVSVSFSNTSLSQGYYVETIGLYATDPQEGEILYSVSIADKTTAIADYMPPYNGVGSSSLMVDLVTVVSNASNVNVVVDPTAVATVSQVVNLQNQIDDVKTYVGYESSEVYGVEYDFANRNYTRLAGAENLTAGADFSSLTPWGGRKRCILTDDGVVLAYRGDTGYTEAGATTAEITVGTIVYPSGTKVQVMVEQPIFYVKVVPVKTKPSTSGKGMEMTKARYYISPTAKAGFKAPDAFKDANGILQDKIYLSAFEGSIYDTSATAYLKADEQVGDFASDLLCSIAGAKPASGLTQNLTRANVRKLCNNRGAGWQSHNIYALSVTQWLILVEYASMDSQRKVGRGVCDFTDDGSTNMAVVTGGTTTLGNNSGIPDGGTDGKCSVTYRGEENLWGNIWTWLDGINILAKGYNDAYLAKAGTTMADDTTTGYDNYGTQLSHQNGYQSAMGYSEDHPDLFLPTACAGSDSAPVGSYYWQNYTYNGFFIALLGGLWSKGSYCGAWFLYVGSTSSHRGRNLGGRLLYVPQTKIA